MAQMIDLKLCSCDVSDRDKVLQLRDQVVKEIGNVSILVNNAGIMPCKQFNEQTPNVIKKQFDVNVFAHFWVSRGLLKN